MMTESELMPVEPREPAARKLVLLGRCTFLLKWVKGSKVVLSGFILSAGLFGIGQEATAGTDWENNGGGWVNQDQRVIPRGGGWVTPSQGWVTPSQGWVTPNQNWGTPNQGWNNPNQGWGHPNQGWGHPNQGWDHCGRGGKGHW